MSSRVELAEGLELLRDDDGMIWITFQATNGKTAVVQLQRIVDDSVIRSAIMTWAKETLRLIPKEES